MITVTKLTRYAGVMFTLITIVFYHLAFSVLTFADSH